MNPLATLFQRSDALCHKAATPLLLLARLVVAWAFFRAGLLKIDNWQGTLYLFELEYQVPLLSTEIAAWLATGIELGLPPLLALGLLTRPTALALLVFNAVAVISYPVLWQQGFYDHRYWGALLLMLLVWGPGKLAIDHLLHTRLGTLSTNPAQA